MMRREVIALLSLSVISIGGISLIELEINVNNQQEPLDQESTAPSTEESDSTGVSDNTDADTASTPDYRFETVAEEHKLDRNAYEVDVSEFDKIHDIATEWSRLGEPEELSQWGSELTTVLYENSAGDPSLLLTPVVIVKEDAEIQLKYTESDPDFYVGHLLSYDNAILSANAFESKENYQIAVEVIERHI